MIPGIVSGQAAAQAPEEPADLAGTTGVTFTPSADLMAVGEGELLGTTGLSFAPTANLEASANLAGATDLTFTLAADLSGVPAALDGLANLTGAWSVSRDLLTSFEGGTRYTTVSSAINLVEDQTGNNRDMVQAAATNRPIIETAGSNSRDAISFDGVDNFLTTTGNAISTLITNSAGYIIASAVVDAIGTNDATVYNNDPIFADSGNFMGLFLKSTGPVALGYNWDGNADSPATHAISTGAVIVVEWKHTGGNFSTRVNGGTWNTVASGNTATMTGTLNMGAETSGVQQFSDIKIIDMATFNATLTTQEEDDLVADFMAWAGT